MTLQDEALSSFRDSFVWEVFLFFMSSWSLFRPVDWDVFVRDLNRQLGTPSHWLPVDSYKKKEDKEAP